MDQALLTLASVLVGSGISLIGVYLLIQSENRRDQQQRLREHLALVDDAIVAMFEQCQIAIEAKRLSAEPVAIDNVALNLAAVRLSMRSIRVGDDPLGDRIDAVMGKLIEAAKAPSYREAVDLINEAHRLLKPMQIRMAGLLHNTARVDYGL